MNRMRTKPAVRVMTMALAMVTLSTAAHAQKTGFMLGVHSIAAQGVTITGEDIDGPAFKTKTGVGGGVTVGYGLSRILSAFVSADVAKQDANVVAYGGSFGLAHLQVGARASLPLGSTVPYVTASYGVRNLAARITDHENDDSQYDFKLNGAMIGIGAGIERSIAPTLALDAGVDLGIGRFTHYDIDGDSGKLDVDGNTTMRLRLGMTWRP
jgi:Outer membrane protein beta-barrel domain